MSVAVEVASPPIIVPGFISENETRIWFHAITRMNLSVFVQVEFHPAIVSEPCENLL
jgi:hypothetical protein